LGGYPGLPLFVGCTPLNRVRLAKLTPFCRLFGLPDWPWPRRCRVDHWITAAPLEVALRLAAGHKFAAST